MRYTLGLGRRHVSCLRLAQSSGVCAVLLVLALSHCSAVDYGVEQCERNEDCAPLAQDGQRLVCEAHVCVDSVSCELNSDCAAPTDGDVEVCVAGTCQLLLTEECWGRYPRAVGAVPDGTVLLGGFAPLSKSERASTPVLLNYELAVAELNNGALPHDFLLVVCDNDNETPEGSGGGTMSTPVEVGYRHLVETLQVPGLVTDFLDSEQVGELAEWSATLPSPPLVLVPGESVGTSKDDSYLWYLGGQPQDYAQAYVELYRLAIAQLQAQRGAEEIRAAVVVGDDAYWRQAFGGFRAALAAAPDELPEQKAFDLGIDSQEETVQELLDWEVELLFVLMSEDYATVFGDLEVGFEASGVPAERWPLYLFSRVQADSGLLLFFLDQDPSLQARLVGLNGTAPASDVYADYVRRLRTMFADVTPNVESLARYYDAVYYLAYSVVAAESRGRDTTDVDLRTGLQRIALVSADERPEVQGEVVPVGPESFNEALTILADDGSSFVLEGATGQAVFGEWSGTRELPIGMYCFADEEAGFEVRRDALFYDAPSGHFVDEGASGFCFDGFWP